jgi:CRP/FNR family transcriptional regulator
MIATALKTDDVKLLPPCVAGIGSQTGQDPAACAGEGQCPAGLHCHVRRLARHQHAFLQNDAQTQVYWVNRGVMRLYKSLSNGRRQIVGFAFPGDFIGLGPAQKYQFSAQAVSVTELRVTPKVAFEAIAGVHADFSCKLYEAVSLDLLRAYDLALTVGQRNSEASLATFLLDMQARAPDGAPADVISLPMPRADIADYLGVTTETVSRTFSKFVRRGLIQMQRRRTVRLLDRPAMEQLAEG